MIYKYKTNIPGLKYRPSFQLNPGSKSLYDNGWDSEDGFTAFNDYISELDLKNHTIYHGPSWTEDNTKFIDNLCLWLLHEFKTLNIMEIGVARDNPSSTPIFTQNATNYFGIDLRNVSYIETAPNIKTLQISSLEQTKIREFVNLPIHLLFIDGDHSINTVLNDWQYQDLVVKGGYIIMHDTNHHPGPHSVFEAINEWDYSKRRACLNDYGLGVIQKLI